MSIGKNYNVAFKRKREHRTDYHARLRLLSARKPRLVVRKALNDITAQIITFEPKGDKTLVAATSRELLKYGWKAHRGNIPSAYLSGLLCGLKAKKKGINEAVLDIGLLKAIQGSSPFAALKGAVDAGLKIAHSEQVLPKDTALKGETISTYSKKLAKENKTMHDKQFADTLKKGLNIQELTKHFEEVKTKILTTWR